MTSDIEQNSFNNELKSLGRFKGDNYEEFKQSLAAFVCAWDYHAKLKTPLNVLLLDYFINSSSIKIMKWTAKYLRETEGEENFVSLLKNQLQEHGSYLRIAEVVIEFNLQKQFGFLSLQQDEMLIPMILCESSDELVKKYVGKEKRLQIQIITWLDNMDDFSIVAKQFPQCKKINCKRLITSKPTTIKKLVEKFNLDLEIIAPNYCFSVRKKDLKYWI